MTNVTLTEILYRDVNTSCMMSCVRLGTSKRVSAPRAARACVGSLLRLSNREKNGSDRDRVFFSVHLTRPTRVNPTNPGQPGKPRFDPFFHGC